MPPRKVRARPKEEEQAERQDVAVPVRWENVERVPIIFANHLFVRLQDDEFLVTFGQVELPYEPVISEDTRKTLEKHGLPLQVVARLAIPPSKMGQMIENLTRVHNTWLERQEQREVP